MSGQNEVVALVNISRQKWPPRQRTYFGSLQIRTPEEGELYAVTPVQACVSVMDLGDRRTMDIKIPAREIADDLVREINGDSGEGSFHGVFVAAGPEPTSDELAEAREKLDAFHRRLVDAADLEWERSHNLMFITDLERRAARELKLDKPWVYDPKPQGECPACGEKIKQGVAVCRTCGAILDAEKAAKFGLGAPREDSAHGSGEGDGEGYEEVVKKPPRAQPVMAVPTKAIPAEESVPPGGLLSKLKFGPPNEWHKTESDSPWAIERSASTETKGKTMSTVGSLDAPIEIFGGLVTDMSPADLPHGVSPDCQDVFFSNGGVVTRPGLQALFGPLPGNPAVNYIKTYITPNGMLRTLALDANGILYKETVTGTLTQVAGGIAGNAVANSTTIFGREYFAFSDGRTGNDLPRQYDDTNFDRVSQGGPGAGPTVIDESAIAGIVASPNGATQPAAIVIAASPNGATENGYLITMTTTIAHGLSIGQIVTIAGVGVSSYNGTFAVVSTLSATQFTYIAGATGLANSGGGTASSSTATIQTAVAHGYAVGQMVTMTGVGIAGYNGTFAVSGVPDATHFTFTAANGGLAASGGGTAAAAGSVAQGKHQVCVIFQTRQGYLTKPSPATSWMASGGKRAVVTNIPTGPANVVARIVCFTGAGGASFYYTGAGSTLFSGNMVINDNTTTSAVMDFSDAILLAATNVDNLFRLIELGDCAGVLDYSERLLWWGERNKMNNWQNLGFDGGFTGPSLPHYPLGWTMDGTFGPGGTDEESFVVWGGAYSIVGNGSTATRGLMTQGAVADSLGAPLIEAGTEYTVRARCARNVLLAQGTLHINLFSGSGAINTVGLQLTASQLTTGYVEYSAQLTPPLGTIPSDLVLRVWADGTPNQNGQFYIDSVEICPTAQPVNASLVRSSRVEDPESYDGINGMLSVAENDGQAIRAGFKLRERLYFVKEHSLYATQDDGTNEPSLWSITEISRRVGTRRCAAWELEKTGW